MFVASTTVLSGLIRDVWPCANLSIPGACCINQNYYCGESLNAGQPTPACEIPGSGWACAVDFERYIGDGIMLNSVVNSCRHRYSSNSN